MSQYRILTHEKINTLKDILNAMEKICIAYSGGVDSFFLAAICREAVGPENVLAVTAVSETYTAAEKSWAEETASFLGIDHILLKTSEIDDEAFANNTPKRCYHCKRNFYEKLIPFAQSRGFDIICDGNQTDDATDYRPGREAAVEYGVRSPLAEAGITKTDIREISHAMDLPGWDRPSNPCLASRIPYGSFITLEKLQAVQDAEAFLKTLGFKILRVRHHGSIARIELPSEDIPAIFAAGVSDAVHCKLKEIGFTWVCIDIPGYRMGSLNEAINKGQDSRLSPE